MSNAANRVLEQHKRALAIDKTYRPARQLRSLKTEARILAAANVLFAQRGFAATRVSDIISQSGCSTGSFYHRFDDKHELLDVMLARYLLQAENELESFQICIENCHSLHQLFVELANRSRALIGANKGLYVAAREKMRDAPQTWQALAALMVQLGTRLDDLNSKCSAQIKARDAKKAMQHAGQLVVMTCLQAELGEGPLLPRHQSELANLLAQAACGITGEAAEAI